MLMDLFKAVRYGEELKDPAKWKKGQLLTNAVGGLLVIAMRYIVPEYDLQPEMVDAATEAIVGVLVCLNLYITKASSKKI